MIRETVATSWQEFPRWLQALDVERRHLKEKTSLHVSDFLYRGHASEEWRLQTTLERFGAPLNAYAYYEAIWAAKPQIETYTGQSWSIPDLEEYAEWLDNQSALGLINIPAYEYLIYLRHHGFPSPLLDWSESPYVAAYFAFHESQQSERIAVYAFIDYAGSARGGFKSEPNVHVQGPYVRSHRRHFLQQSQYTICTQFANDAWHYASHEDAFATGNEDQDLLWRFTLPRSERKSALRHLDSFNLNAFSLFGSEESLMQTMAIRTLTNDDV